MNKNIKKFVKGRYGEIAKKSASCCAPASCGCGTASFSKEIGYSGEELASIPKEADLGLGCGNPTAYAELKTGETVLDLGSGAGIDVFLAAKKVGPTGYAIGVDMTQEMIERARANAVQNGYKNVEFRLGEIEKLPVDDNSIDVIISNCVINLSPDKLKTFKEAYRVLKKGGRILISDLVTEGELPESIKKSFEAWGSCIGGALEKDKYINTIKKAGFSKVEVVSESSYSEPDMNGQLAGKIISLKVRAYK